MRLIILSLSLVVFFACTKKEAPVEDTTETQGINIESEDGSVSINSNGINIESEDGNVNINLKDALEGIGADSDVEVVNFRELKELLPEKLVGLARTDIEGETTGAMGFKVSTANATFEEDGKSIDVEISDLAGMGGMIQAAAGWSMAEIDRESGDEYERTTTIDGHKAFEKYNKKSQRGEIAVLVANRYVVKVEGDGVSMDDLKDALKKIGLNRVSRLG